MRIFLGADFAPLPEALHSTWNPSPKHLVHEPGVAVRHGLHLWKSEEAEILPTISGMSPVLCRFYPVLSGGSPSLWTDLSQAESVL